MRNDRNVDEFLTTLNAESEIYGISLPPVSLPRLAEYYQLLGHWNPRLHLVAPCSPSEFARRHILESLFLLNHLSIEAKIIDVGSGGGLPIIPCLIARPNLEATLIESSQKKSVFLREALKLTSTAGATVLAERFENVPCLQADFLTCRALDRFSSKLPEMIDWAPDSATLLLYGGEELGQQLSRLGIGFEASLLPASRQRFLFTARK